MEQGLDHLWFVGLNIHAVASPRTVIIAPVTQNYLDWLAEFMWNKYAVQAPLPQVQLQTLDRLEKHTDLLLEEKGRR